MKHKAIHYAGLLAAVFAAGVCLGSDNPNVANPNASAQSFRSRTNPVSSGQTQRFVNRGNTYGTTGNDIVTGNVGGMKYFHGVVPYGSTYYSSRFADDLGTSSVSNFLRRSSEPIVMDRSPGRVASYYDPRQTVTSFQKSDGVSMFSPTPPAGQGRANPYATPLASLPMENPYRQRPLSSNNQELELLLSRQAELKESANLEAAQRVQESYKLKSIFDQTLTPEEIQEVRDAEAAKKAEEQARQEQKLLEELDKKPLQTLPEEPAQSQKEKTEQTPAVIEKLDQDLQKALESLEPDEGRKILGEHKTFRSLAEAKFDAYMKTAEGFLQEGLFYKAADTFALAAVWKPQDGRGYAGQSFALFAAGEYMSSAYYLSRAFELDPNLASAKVDLAALIGDRDVYENRVVEMTTWQQRGGSGELAFLMAYVLWQDNKPEPARRAMEDAAKSMPDSRAVAALKNVILPDKPAP
jgi:hypothetical protein